VLAKYLNNKFGSNIELGNNLDSLKGEVKGDFLYKPHILCCEGYLPEKILGIMALLYPRRVLTGLKNPS
jgi:hypothetical protein